MVMTSDETQIQIFANRPMSHAKGVTRDNRKNPEYGVVAAIRKLRIDTNCPVLALVPQIVPELSAVRQDTAFKISKLSRNLKQGTPLSSDLRKQMIELAQLHSEGANCLISFMTVTTASASISKRGGCVSIFAEVSSSCFLACFFKFNFYSCHFTSMNLSHISNRRLSFRRDYTAMSLLFGIFDARPHRRLIIV